MTCSATVLLASGLASCQHRSCCWSLPICGPLAPVRPVICMIETCTSCECSSLISMTPAVSHLSPIKQQLPVWGPALLEPKGVDSSLKRCTTRNPARQAGCCRQAVASLQSCAVVVMAPAQHCTSNGRIYAVIPIETCQHLFLASWKHTAGLLSRARPRKSSTTRHVSCRQLCPHKSPLTWLQGRPHLPAAFEGSQPHRLLTGCLPVLHPPPAAAPLASAAAMPAPDLQHKA